MQKEDVKPASESLLFFDVETEVLPNTEHKVNYVVSQDFHGNCKSFEGDDALDNFCEYLFDDQHRGYSVISHYGSKFDIHFVLTWLLKHRATSGIQLIRNGLQIIQLRVNAFDIRLIDSFLWFSLPLDKLAKTFDLDTARFSKGTFPHLFNTSENWNYCGPIPDIKYYFPDNLSTEKRQKLIDWHSSLQNSNYVFNFKEEIRKYCIQDVNILRESCLRFRQIFLDETGTDPFRYLTIASTVMALYKDKFLKPETIAIVPKHNYRGVQKPFSNASIQWLDFVSYKTGKKIKHALNGGEKRIFDEQENKFYYVDGLAGKTVYEFYGCVFHSCNRCYQADSLNPFRPNSTNKEVYNETLHREDRLRALGYEVKFIWYCDFEILSQTPEFKDFISTHVITGNLNPRDSFAGGRVCPNKLFYKVKPGEKIRYVDFTSLYPFVNKTKEYPIGHPKIIRENFGDINDYFGIIRCKILPPANLLFGVLPYHANGKLLFPLCKSCVDDPKLVCRHTSEQRALTGTWVTLEVQKAFELGYELLEIYEVFHFEQKSTELFKDYVNTFLRSKQESSGFPEWAQNDNDRAQYIQNYFDHEGISLRPDRIRPNGGLRAISKLVLNSIWGRFAQREERTNSELVYEPKRFFEIAHGAEYDLHDFFILNDHVAELIFSQTHEYRKESLSTNIFIATFTTSYARLELYRLLEKYQERVLYFDTDSVILVQHDDDPSDYIQLGDYLGDLTDEITKDHGSDHFSSSVVARKTTPTELPTVLTQ